MALKLDYVVRETGRNLRRNLTLTLASVLTVAVSLSLLGVALLVRAASTTRPTAGRTASSSSSSCSPRSATRS